MVRTVTRAKERKKGRKEGWRIDFLWRNINMSHDQSFIYKH